MPGDVRVANRLLERSDAAEEETRSLLSGSSNTDDDDVVIHPGRTDHDNVNSHTSPSHLRSNAARQSSISRPPPDGERRTPRTPNRVRFDLDDELEEEPRP